jgi:hypothetical protein
MDMGAMQMVFRVIDPAMRSDRVNGAITITKIDKARHLGVERVVGIAPRDCRLSYRISGSYEQQRRR